MTEGLDRTDATAINAPPGESEPHLREDGPPSLASTRALQWAMWPQLAWVFLLFVALTNATVGPQLTALMLAIELPALAVLAVTLRYVWVVFSQAHSTHSRRRATWAAAAAAELLLIGPAAAVVL